MDLAQLFIVDLGWIFLTAWGAVLFTLAGIAFAPDLRGFARNRQTRLKHERSSVQSVSHKLHLSA
jgi:hypothetical protein